MKMLKEGLITAALLFMGLTPVHTIMSAHAGSTTPELSPAPGQAVVIVYRDKKLKASGANYKTYLNDVPLAVLTNGTWAGAVVQPGSYDLWIEMYNPTGLISRVVTAFQFDANLVYFVKEDSSSGGLKWAWRANATLVDERTARREISGLQEAKSLALPTEQESSDGNRFIFINRLPSPSK